MPGAHLDWTAHLEASCPYWPYCCCHCTAVSCLVLSKSCLARQAACYTACSLLSDPLLLPRKSTRFLFPTLPVNMMMKSRSQHATERHTILFNASMMYTMTSDHANGRLRGDGQHRKTRDCRASHGWHLRYMKYIYLPV